MSWKCNCCDSFNEDTIEYCLVCGTPLPFDVPPVISSAPHAAPRAAVELRGKAVRLRRYADALLRVNRLVFVALALIPALIAGICFIVLLARNDVDPLSNALQTIIQQFSLKIVKRIPIHIEVLLAYLRSRQIPNSFLQHLSLLYPGLLRGRAVFLWNQRIVLAFNAAKSRVVILWGSVSVLFPSFRGQFKQLIARFSLLFSHISSRFG